MVEHNKESLEADTLAKMEPLETLYHDEDPEIQVDDVPHSSTHGIPVRKRRPKPMPKRRFVDD